MSKRHFGGVCALVGYLRTDDDKPTLTQGVLMYDPEMELAYEDGAAAFDVEVTIIDPATGDQATAMVDNLTNAMYWIVGHGLLPVREGYRERTPGDFNLHYGGIDPNTPEEHLTAEVAKSLHAQWRAENLHSIILTITCHGDPALISQGL
jgi:hypothetical protein